MCCFRLSGHKDLGDRLVECMYELTDRLAYYLCLRRPDHQIGQHYIVPELSDTIDLTEFTKAAKKKLQLVREHHIWHYLLLSTFANWLIAVRWKESTGITGGVLFIVTLNIVLHIMLILMFIIRYQGNNVQLCHDIHHSSQFILHEFTGKLQSY